MKESEFKSLNFTMLGKGSEYEGDLRLSGDTVVNCKILGTLTILDGSKLTIEREAMIEGSIYCKDVEIFGEVSGSISAAGSMVVRSSGKVSGNIEAKNLSVYPGALLNIEGRAQE
ncbi:MAG: polymer-forming cytoskeletal protein [Bacteriovoracaceae bacterium]|nr:polymer-forming cytoskeletal protein [Bacteriovoracaceae bacterium]